MPRIGVSVVDGGGETPGPIPNPEAKPARADGTAPGREWESRLPPTQQLHTRHPPRKHNVSQAGAFSYVRLEPTRLDSALRTTTPAPIIGAHPRTTDRDQTPHCGQPRRHHPAGCDLLRGHIGGGASTRSHDDASCGAKVEYRTSSTPAYTDELDLHYSTNNAPTTGDGPDSALRTTPDTPTMGAYP